MNMLIIAAVIIAVICVLWGIGTYNRLVRLLAYVREAWSGVEVQLKRRYDLIPNLVETVKGYQIHEKSTLEAIAQYRSAAMHAKGVTERAEAEAALTNTLKTLFAVAENYPELKANENFLQLQHQLGTIEHEIQLARRYYNGTTRDYNMNVQSFPTRIIAGFTGFKEQPYFEVDNADERNAPRVKF